MRRCDPVAQAAENALARAVAEYDQLETDLCAAVATWRRRPCEEAGWAVVAAGERFLAWAAGGHP